MSIAKIYTGDSETVGGLVDGYVDYSEEVITNRAVSDIRDGLKPVNRRVIYIVWTNKTDHMVKSPDYVGKTMGIHPHGDGSIYGAMALMTDENGSWQVPVLNGLGNWGKVYSSEKPADMRYTKCKINKYTGDFFREEDVMHMIRSEEGEGFEPEVLNAIYPVVLVNGSRGIAVTTGTAVPSFNFNDVLDLTIKYIQNGKLEVTDTIIPDFQSGGVLVCNNEEITKIMLTGRGKLKVRAKVEIEGSTILVKEVPFGKSAEGIKRAIDNTDIEGVKSVLVEIGRNAPSLVTVMCKSKKVVEEVLMRLYSSGILQSTFSSSILVLKSKKPKILGVHDIIKEWVPWRKEVLNEKFTKLLDGIKNEKHQLQSFISVIDDEEKKEEFILLVAREGKQSATSYLKDNFPDITPDEANWIYERGLSAFHRGGTYRTRYENLLKYEEEYTSYLADIDSYIVRELQTLREERKNDFPRKTEVTYTDYKFSRISNSDEVEDDSFCVYTMLKNGFLLKSRNGYEDDGSIQCEIPARANSILVGFDNYGRVLRVIGKEIPFTKSGESGVYLPKYFGVEDDVESQFGYKILYMSLLDGTKKTLVYRDGYIGFFDTEEFMGKKNIKVISNGVCTAVRDKLLEVIEEEDTPDYLLLADDTQTKIRIGVVQMSEVAERSRTSRAKVLSGTEINTCYLKGFRGFGLVQFISNADDYIGKFKVFKGDWLGDPEEVSEGSYLEMCPDIVQ